MHLKKLLQSEELRKFLKFGITGVMNTLIDFIVYTLCVSLTSLNVFASQVLGYACGTLNSYIVNRSWTFHSRNRFFSGEMAKFLIVNLITLGVSLVVMGWLRSTFALHEILLKLPVTGVTIVLNFTLSRLWVFRGSGKGQDSH